MKPQVLQLKMKTLMAALMILTAPQVGYSATEIINKLDFNAKIGGVNNEQQALEVGLRESIKTSTPQEQDVVDMIENEINWDDHAVVDNVQPKHLQDNNTDLIDTDYWNP